MNTNVLQTDIFSMFDIEDEVTEKMKREEEERQKRLEEAKKKAEEAKKAASNTSAKSATKKDEEVFDVTMDTVIRYLGEDIPVSQYFTPEELTQGLPSKKKNEEEVTFKKIDGNEVRKRMEKDYPELIAQYTEMVYIKKKNIILPVQKAKKKGNDCMQEESLSGDSSSFMPKRIPFTLLQEFIALSKYFSEKYGTEVHGDIYLNLSTNEFFLDIPEQVVSPVFTEVIEDAIVTAEKLIDIPHKKVMEIHSHHVMSATPSMIDDANEQREGIFYAIVGRIDHFFPELTVRVFSNELQKHFDLDPSLVFEHPANLSWTSKYDLSNVQVVK